MANHRWVENTCCRCGITREPVLIKTLMAIDRGHDYYKSVMGFRYSTGGNVRPECVVSTGKKTVFRVEDMENNI
jgi:hypothetical protein